MTPITITLTEREQHLVTTALQRLVEKVSESPNLAVDAAEMIERLNPWTPLIGRFASLDADAVSAPQVKVLDIYNGYAFIAFHQENAEPWSVALTRLTRPTRDTLDHG